ncbi:nucleoid associated protein NdpA [Gramella sp. Hel_I_59]|uniref:nucleoid-associated protein n=1 Tax=Gramella sp. Hel_I_59 TaxID=1249978 RepID=UPI00114DAED7|nr:nucleoid-associated protein [Gramella sp. Hel_I_59]TQI71789.1 nucleoid associated protein NdpA [Gramella sp. Hel_I_59]
MINLYNTQIDELYIHQVGNKCRGEKLFISEQPYEITDEIRPLLKEFFLKPFREKDEQYFKFEEFSELEVVLQKELDIPYYRGDRDVAQWLYDQGVHPHIKSGELYFCRLSNMELDNEKVEGFGIFKSELRDDFLQFSEGKSQLEMNIQQGVNLKKLDKGALILTNPESKTGFRILYIDSNKYDSKYWLENFLNLEELEDAIFHTKNYLEFCRGFAKDVVKPAEDKQQEVLFLNHAFDYFASNDAFEESDFVNNAIENPDLVPEFQNYKIEKGPKYKVEDLTSFEIDNTAVTEIRKKNKSQIDLDTNISIKMDFINADSADKFIEKGWDEEKQMYYYLCYFNKELK